MADKYYYADGRKIPLEVSDRFMAVRADEGARGRLGAMAARASSTMAPVQVHDVPEYGLSVLILPNGGTPAAARGAAREALSAMVGAERSLSEGPEVLEPEGAGGMAVIPVGEVIVKFKPGASAEARRKLLDKHKLEMKRQDYPEPGADLMITEGDAIAAANALQESDAVVLAQPNFVHIAAKLGLDTDFDSEAEEESPAGPATGQLPMADPGFASQWNLQKISAPQAWEISQGSPSISIAIIDEGCDMSHEDIVYMGGYDAYSGDGDPQPDGNDAHGTACAGVAAARKDNGLGGVGVAPGCRVVGIRIARGIGGGFWDTTDAKVADGIRQATDLGADVLSNSYQVGDSSVVTNAFVYARTNGRGGRGCPIAAAAGNNDTPPVIYPARLSPTIPGFLAVSATNEWDQRKSTTSLDGETWWGSSYGPEVDVGAPGVHIYASDIMGGAGYGAGNYIPNFNGTSSATPHVAGLMGLILSVDPELRSWEVEDIIKQTADDLGPSGRDDEFGFGRINARRALEAASRIWYEITVKPVFLGTGKTCFIRVKLRMFNPGINTVRLDGLTLSSHNPTWTNEIDRFEYRPNPGNVLAPRAGHDVTFDRILLRANGNKHAWSYRWSLNWGYTFWRPTGPSFPLVADPDVARLGTGTSGTRQVRGSDEGRSGGQDSPAAGMPESAGIASDDTVTVDRQSRTITVVVR